jgi:hypothetical protein
MGGRKTISKRWRVFAPLALAVLVVTSPSAAQTAAAKPKAAMQKATLLLASDVACTVKLDG